MVSAEYFYTLPIIPVSLRWSWHRSALSLESMSTQSCTWSSPESHRHPHKSTAFFFHTFTTHKFLLFFGLWLCTAVHHHIQVPFLTWHRQNGVRLISKSCFPLQLVLFCICWHWAPPVILFTLVLFSGAPTNIPHSWQTPKVLFKRSVLEYSTLNLLFCCKWIHLVLYLAFAPRQYITSPNRNKWCFYTFF